MKDRDKSPWATDIVREAIRVASDTYGRRQAARFVDMLESVGPVTSGCESPIEAVFWIWWQYFDSVDGLAVPLTDIPVLVAQHEIELGGSRYRLDFALPESKVAIELDGHEFHERTREQVEYRNRRDRDLQTAGWRVFHFSGSEIWRQPWACVAEVADFLDKGQADAWGA